jgi:phosphatidate cytidylyltransferase
MAYIVGSFFGKTPLSIISPKKTLEGTIGGIILCVLIMGFAGIKISTTQQISSIHWFLIAALSAIAGTYGDLFESKFKRMANVKDSGSFMPGHGGFLDRFDSMLFAIPAVWIYLKLFL